MINLSIRGVIATREHLISHLRESGVAFKSCHLRVHDRGISLVVVAPTSEIPEEFQGVPVERQDPV